MSEGCRLLPRGLGAHSGKAVHTSGRPWPWMASWLCTQGLWRPELASYTQSWGLTQGRSLAPVCTRT